jgi:hypothetical protein
MACLRGELWRREIAHWRPLRPIRKRSFFGGLCQKVVAMRADG